MSFCNDGLWGLGGRVQNQRTDGVCRLAKCGELDRLAAVGGFEDVLKDSPTTGSSVRNGGGGQRGME